MRFGLATQEIEHGCEMPQFAAQGSLATDGVLGQPLRGVDLRLGGAELSFENEDACQRNVVRYEGLFIKSGRGSQLHTFNHRVAFRLGPRELAEAFVEHGQAELGHAADVGRLVPCRFGPADHLIVADFGLRKAASRGR